MRLLAARAVVAAVLVTVAATASGCAAPASNSSGQPDAIQPTAVAGEYVAEQASLHLAPGWAWPKDPTPRKIAPDGSSLVYQRGYGTTAADHYWYCSWEAALVGAKTPTARDAALAALQKVHDTHYYKADLLPLDKGRFDAILTKAGLGDYSGVQIDVTANCPAGPA